nr:MAG TPA: hypothetical protein [Caudoviricetes sp.]
MNDITPEMGIISKKSIARIENRTITAIYR